MSSNGWLFNKLKLNGDKTELLVLTARHRHPPPLDSILTGADVHVMKAAKSVCLA